LAGGGPTLLCHGAGAVPSAALAQSGAGLLALAAGDRGLDLQQLLAELGARQCNEILVESGPRLAGALLQAGLLDELIVYMAPTLLGDRARPLLSLPIDDMAAKVPLQIADVRKIGQDWRFTAIPA
jgi:diaminohydroxyphosphoribosylaminopyrimidine deaminase/5-amino-6-(5-phosphoribosylamino)uracil reductase